MNRQRILVADDDFDVLDLLRYLLEMDGYEVITSANGYEAMGAAMLHRPDLAVLDVMMPGENGYRVSRALRTTLGAEVGQIPIVLVTARDLSADPDRERFFLEFSGASEVIYKPFDSNFVLRRINELLNAGASAKTGAPIPLTRLVGAADLQLPYAESLST